MKLKTIKQKALIPASPDKVYKALMSSKEHTAFTGAAAKIKDKAGAVFTAYDGYIQGKNLLLLRGKRIFQTWRASETKWPEGHFSLVEYKLKKKGNGTEIIFTQTEVPSANAKSMSSGWKTYYWEPLKAYFGKKK